MDAAKQDHNFVADAQNWEARVKTELDASNHWYNDWGSLYAPDQPQSYGDRIAALKQAAERIPGVRLQTNNSMYGSGKPFNDFAKPKVKKPDLI